MHQLCTCLQKPTPERIEEADRVLSYLSRHSSVGLTYTKAEAALSGYAQQAARAVAPGTACVAQNNEPFSRSQQPQPATADLLGFEDEEAELADEVLQRIIEGLAQRGRVCTS